MGVLNSPMTQLFFRFGNWPLGQIVKISDGVVHVLIYNNAYYQQKDPPSRT